MTMDLSFVGLAIVVAYLVGYFYGHEQGMLLQRFIDRQNHQNGD